MEIQVNKPKVVIMLMRYLKILFESSEIFMNASKPKLADMIRAYTGIRFELVFLKICGAEPSIAKLYKVREETYRSVFAAEKRKIKIQALTIPGRTLIDAS